MKEFSSDQWIVDEFNCITGSEQLLLFASDQQLPSIGTCEARVLMQKATGEVVEFNPKNGLAPGCTLWAFRSGRVRELAFDPKEWLWPREGMLKETNFFNYSCKRGYRIIIKDQCKQLGFDKWLEVSGYSFTQRREFFTKLWHCWIPRKVSSMVWLTIAEGLPIGEWRRCCLGQEGFCTLCDLRVLQTSEHGLFGCESVKEAWSNLRRIHSLAGRQPGSSNMGDCLIW